MYAHRKSFPAVRACIFDLDGLLINSEDILTRCINRVLANHARPSITRDIRVQMMGVPNSTSSDIFHDWAKLPISREQFKRELIQETNAQFVDCEPMPGAEKLLSNLTLARSSSGNNVALALASTTENDIYQIKISKPNVKTMLDCIRPNRRILGDDPRVEKNRKKPAPDIYNVALQSLGAAISHDDDDNNENIQPEECLVFEDSVIGVEAGRRAGMRVVWVPHPDVEAEWHGREKQVLVGKTGTSKLADEWQVCEVDDGWAESISSPEHFDSEKYGIHVPTSCRRSECKSPRR